MRRPIALALLVVTAAWSAAFVACSSSKGGGAGPDAGDDADEAGVEEGDLLIGFGGKPVKDIDDLHRALTEEAIGRLSRLTVARKDGPLDLAVTPREMKEETD